MIASIATTAPSMSSESVCGERQHGRRVHRDQAVELVALRPQDHRHDRADQRELDQALDEIHQRDLGEQPLEAGPERDLGELRLEASADHTSRCCTCCRRSPRASAAANGSAIAAIVPIPSFCMMTMRPRPSTGIACAWRSSPRSMPFMPLLIAPENDSRIRVAAPRTNQVLTSWLLTTSPRSSASSSRFWVGSSDLLGIVLFVGHRRYLTNRAQARAARLRHSRGSFPSWRRPRAAGSGSRS